MSSDDFYIGWDDGGRSPLPRTWVLGLVLVLAAVGAGITSLLSAAPASRFEFGVERDFEGVLRHVPYPTLQVERPGGGSSSWLLTVFGKRGAGTFTEALDGHRVRFTGSLIHRDDVTMVELLPDSIEDLGEATDSLIPAAGEARRVVLRGEIVDSKCFLGVMKPGNTKVHRACATRCISGGVPPVLLVRGEDGVATYYLMVDASGGPMNEQVLPFVAEPVEVTGAATSLGSLERLAVDEGGIVRIER